jgi:hypothetical protein
MIRKPKKPPLSETHPELASQWHPTKNGSLVPSESIRSADFVYHLNNFEQSDYSKEFMKLFTLSKVIIAGDASDELKAKAKAYGAELRPQVGGWIN